MARGMTRVVMVGNLGRDPDLRYSQSGTAVAGFSLAVGRWDGQAKAEVTDWYQIRLFGKQAENAAEWLHKGDRCQIDGRLQLRSYTTNDGQERQSVDVLADGFLNLSGVGERAGDQSNRPLQPAQHEQDDLDDVPF